MGSPLVALELDALIETASIATARAARALAEFTGRNVWMTPPTLHWTPGVLRDRGEHAAAGNALAVGSTVLGALSGSILFVVSAESANQLIGMLLGPRAAGPNDPLSRSCVTETANILVGAYLSSLAEMTGGTYQLGVPSTVYVPEHSLWDELEASGAWPMSGLCIETELSVGDTGSPLPCRLYLLGDRGAFAEALSQLKAWD
jgi:chemotaxis protein CheY-P-specific phosphatase CheC